MRDKKEVRQEWYDRNKDEINRKRRLKKYKDTGRISKKKSNVIYHSFDNPCKFPCFECPHLDCIINDYGTNYKRRNRCS